RHLTRDLHINDAFDGGLMMKLCTRCKIEKPLDDFHNCKRNKSGKMSQCKDCRNAYNRKKAKEIGHDVLYRRVRDRNPEEYKRKRREYYLANKEKIKERSREWRSEEHTSELQSRF